MKKQMPMVVGVLVVLAGLVMPAEAQVQIIDKTKIAGLPQAWYYTHDLDGDPRTEEWMGMAIDDADTLWYLPVVVRNGRTCAGQWFEPIREISKHLPKGELFFLSYWMDAPGRGYRYFAQSNNFVLSIPVPLPACGGVYVGQ